MTESFQDRGYVQIVYPSKLKVAVLDAMKSWKNFCALPEETKTKVLYEENAGYELKKTPGDTLDLKENFHITLRRQKELKEQASQNTGIKDTDFIDAGVELISLVEPMILNFARQLEKDFSLPGLAKEVVDNRENWTLRFLHYFGGCNPGDEIASPHADKGGFTLHLYESDPGLECLTYDKKWVEMPVSESDTVVIPGMQLQYRSNNALKALCHRVVATPKTAKSGRFSAVLFVGMKNVASYNKDAVGRLQQFAPGFNYNVSFGELSKLFK